MNLSYLLSLLGKKSSQEEFQVPKSREQTVLFHWKIIITVFFIIMFLIFATGILIYRDIGRGEFFSGAKITAPSTGTGALKNLDTVVDNFEKKVTTFEQVRKSRTSSVDPSR